MYYRDHSRHNDVYSKVRRNILPFVCIGLEYFSRKCGSTFDSVEQEYFSRNIVLHLVVLSLNIFLENVVLHLVIFQVILCGKLFSTNHLHRHRNTLSLSLSIFSFPPMKQNLYKMLSKTKNYRGLNLYFHITLYLQLFVVGLLSYLHYLCLFVHSGGQHILCCVFALFFFVYVVGFSGLSI